MDIKCFRILGCKAVTPGNSKSESLASASSIDLALFKPRKHLLLPHSPSPNYTGPVYFSKNLICSKMADGQLFKPEKDFTKEVDKQLPEAEELAKVLVACIIDGISLTIAALEQCSLRDRKALDVGEANTTGTALQALRSLVEC